MGKKCMKTTWKNVLRDNNNTHVKGFPLLKVSGKLYQIWRLKTNPFMRFFFFYENTSISRMEPLLVALGAL